VSAKRSAWIVAAVFLPWADALPGYINYRIWAAAHPGQAISERQTADGVLLESFAAMDGGGFRVAERRYADFVYLSRVRPPLAGNYVQSFTAPAGDSHCIEFPSYVAPPPAGMCHAVTTSERPISRYAYYVDPTLVVANGSALFPVYATRKYVYEIETGRVLAERWTFIYRSWLARLTTILPVQTMRLEGPNFQLQDVIVPTPDSHGESNVGNL
jgi:hypothetical protein